MDEQKPDGNGKALAIEATTTTPTTPPRGGAAARRRLEKGVINVFRWTLRVLVIAAGLWLLGWVIGQLWSIVCRSCWRCCCPPCCGRRCGSCGGSCRRHSPRSSPCSAWSLVIGGLIALFVPVISSEGENLATQFSSGLESLQNWLSGPPFNLGDNAVGGLLDQAVSLPAGERPGAGRYRPGHHRHHRLGGRDRSSSRCCSPSSCSRTGPASCRGCRGWIGRGAGGHVGEVSGRVWDALGHYVWSQAAVAAIDGVLIGLGVWLVGVPLALPIAVLTFFGGFIPIVGAFAAGAVAVVVALVTNGVGPALIVLAIIVVVQQVEGNVLQPILVSKSLKIHAAVVLGGVALGGTLFGVVGAFWRYRSSRS